MNHTYLQQVLLNKEKIFCKEFLFIYFLQIFTVQETANHTNTETVEAPQKLFLKQVMKKSQVQLRKLSKLQY